MPPIRIIASPSRCCLSSQSTQNTIRNTNTRIITSRALSTTASLSRQTPSHLTVPTDQVPDYPYGPFRTYKQANHGLFAGSKIRFGNTVAEEHGNKSRTTWLPNRHTKRLWSPSLGSFIRTRLTARVLRTIDRLGGIDEYLLGSKTRRIKDLGPAGWALRWKIMQTPAIRERFARERAALGLPPKEVATGSDSAAQELASGGVTNDMLNEIDGMLERGDEFVIGEVKEGEEMVIKGDAEAIEEAREAARDVGYHMEQEETKENKKTPGS
ncbi:ribosomal L28 family-domain-containing protein [Hypoxylon trugodes]|uniref:ribosomal L28 family-domain-containing protein n=1 Tax=Hypoxylon trugodes TaxID=326681 RepID=UPI002198A548|nr:ribosomal L28 family-domain-containing protein [Hypoxylon trugodes]KAI1382898.1 ribosomal L28 family-domain-containing protein [Hypoxylon trugodes]